MDNIETRITNISTNRNKDTYTDYAKRIAKHFPEYNFIVDGGSFRFHDCAFVIDKENKTIRLDFYLPLYIHHEKCIKWAIKEIKRLIATNE